ncbi:MAG: hypothetical protein HXY44_11980 [Syntrophaceae bacterium]|nr:hypothetical protein [Syntrophaceae bacterium]
MSIKGPEPKRLLKGKTFHKKIQKDWHKNAEGPVKTEKSITKPSGRKGRIDVLAQSDNSLVAVAEIKASDWDTMTISSVRRSVRRQATQVWDYIESQLESGRDVSPGIIFPKRPRDTELLKLIEGLFEAKGLSVVWDDESLEDRKARI